MLLIILDLRINLVNDQVIKEIGIRIATYCYQPIYNCCNILAFFIIGNFTLDVISIYAD